jgi:hypothetical protein
MPRPFRRQRPPRTIESYSTREYRDRFVRRLYQAVGPKTFYELRLAWLKKNGKTTSYLRLVEYLKSIEM